MRKFIVFFLIILLLAPVAVCASSNVFKLNQGGQLSVEQIDGLASFFNRQFLFIGFFGLFFLVLWVGAVVGLWKRREANNLKLKIFIIFQLIILTGLVAAAGISAIKNYQNKKIIEQGVSVQFDRGNLEKFFVKSGRHSELKKYIYKINADEYVVWPTDLLEKVTNNEFIEFCYIELLDARTLKSKARQKIIINWNFNLL